VQVVPALVGYFLVHSGHLSVGLLLPLTAFNLPGGMARQQPEFRQALPQPARIFDQLTGGQGCESLQADIHADPVSGEALPGRRIRQLEHQADVPALIDPLDHGMFDFCLIRDAAVVVQGHLTHILQVQPPLALLFLDQLAAVTVGVFEAAETLATFEPWMPRLFSCLQAAKKGREGLVQAPEGVLQAGSVQLTEGLRVLPALIPEMRPLGCVADALAGCLVGGNALLQGSVIDYPGLPELEVQALFLLWRWAETVLVGAQHRNWMTGLTGNRTSVLQMMLVGQVF
jgi:hypothetical protein